MYHMQKVLVIDDSDDVREVIVNTLTHFGFSAREAKNGAVAIEMAKAERPDLIICDVRMPEMDGYQTLSALRDLPGFSNVPFIFLTASIEKSDMRRGMVSGADDYLTKPCKPEELIEAVTTRLARQAELKCEIYKRAEKLRENVVHLLSTEMVGPLDGILNMTSEMMRDSSELAPEKVFVHARHINESVTRLNQLAKSLT